MRSAKVSGSEFFQEFNGFCSGLVLLGFKSGNIEFGRRPIALNLERDLKTNKSDGSILPVHGAHGDKINVVCLFSMRVVANRP